MSHSVRIIPQAQIMVTKKSCPREDTSTPGEDEKTKIPVSRQRYHMKAQVLRWRFKYQFNGVFVQCIKASASTYNRYSIAQILPHFSARVLCLPWFSSRNDATKNPLYVHGWRGQNLVFSSENKPTQRWVSVTFTTLVTAMSTRLCRVFSNAYW